MGCTVALLLLAFTVSLSAREFRGVYDQPGCDSVRFESHKDTEIPAKFKFTSESRSSIHLGITTR